MIMSKVRVLVFIGMSVGVAAAHAQQPSNQSSSGAPTPATTVPAAPTSTGTTTPASPSAAVLKQARLAGYHVKKLPDGKMAFCKNEARLGSRFSTESCIDEAQFTENLIRAQDQRDKLNNRLGTLQKVK